VPSGEHLLPTGEHLAVISSPLLRCDSRIEWHQRCSLHVTTLRSAAALAG